MIYDHWPLAGAEHIETFQSRSSLRINSAARQPKAIAAIPREQWGQHENTASNFVHILFPNVSAFLAPKIAQIAQLFPGPTPETNRTLLLYARLTPPADEADQAQLEQMINFLRDVTYNVRRLLRLCHSLLARDRVRRIPRESAAVTTAFSASAGRTSLASGRSIDGRCAETALVSGRSPDGMPV